MIVRNNKRTTNKTFQTTQITKPILIIEDQESLLNMLKQILVDKYAAEVHTATNYAQAKVHLSKHRHEYHVAICDLNLPDAPNGEIVDLLNRAKVKMIPLTGSFGEGLRASMIDKGVVDYITKDSINAYEYVVDLVGRLHKNLNIKILLVDDSQSSLSIIQHMLALQNFAVITAANGQDALDLYHKNQDIKLVLTDYNMPEMDGFNLTLELRKIQPKEQLSIIGLSASGKNDLGAQFIKNGANDFITKPVAYEELLCRVNQNISMLEYMEALRYAANRDFLTGLYNRRYFFGEGESLYNLAVEIKGSVIVAMIDIDYFKKINDTYGHEVGDEVLVFFSNKLTSYFNEDLVARIGGEEFALLFTQLDKSQVFNRLDTFRQTIADSIIDTHDLSLSMTVSIGMHDLLDDNLDGMLKIADEKLYHAKEGGRNQVVG